jgi:ABC-type molybdate transport system permease subunit
MTFVAGVALAFPVARSRFGGREGLDSLDKLPLLMPPKVRGFIVCIGNQGWLGLRQPLDAGELQPTAGTVFS